MHLMIVDQRKKETVLRFRLKYEIIKHSVKVYLFSILKSLKIILGYKACYHHYKNCFCKCCSSFNFMC